MEGANETAMRRREVITLLGGAAVTSMSWPLAARAQQGAVPVIGFLNAASAQSYAPFTAAFLQGLAETGHLDGRNLGAEYPWAEGQHDRLPPLPPPPVHHHVPAIAAPTHPPAQPP